MRNFEDTFETRKRSLFSAFSICMTVPLKKKDLKSPQVLKSPLVLTWKKLTSANLKETWH